MKINSRFTSQGKLRKFAKKSGKTQGICEKSGKLWEFRETTQNHEFDNVPEGRDFLQFGACVSCAMCPGCVHGMTCYGGFLGVYGV